MRSLLGEDIRTQSFLDRLSPAVRTRLIRDATVKTFAKGAVLWRRGNRATHAYIVLGGRVGIFDTQENEDDPPAVIEMFHAGDAILAVPVLDPGAKYIFSGKAIDDVSALSIPVAVYRRYLPRDNALLFATVLTLAASWRRLIVEIRNLKRLSANRRLGFYLLALADRRNGAATVRLVDDQLIVAGMLGVTRAPRTQRGWPRL